MGKIRQDLQAAMDKDPAARSKLEIFFTYGGGGGGGGEKRGGPGFF